ncbi:hypothetical protein [Paraflavitalea speifideaquila]|uniref:hypothetical protein n=1 Tax=Paraflavitalea speifideaquila TaxID=3076558 RepID=UPI0028ED7557|nr:hypothetical protein [Paraflavitalea speifideiaquila]
MLPILPNTGMMIAKSRLFHQLFGIGATPDTRCSICRGKKFFEEVLLDDAQRIVIKKQ